MSAIHSSHRKLRHLRQIIGRGLVGADSHESCFYTISINNEVIFQSPLSEDAINPQWDAIPQAVIEEQGSAHSFALSIFTASKKPIFDMNVDLRSIFYVAKTVASLPPIESGATILLRCADGVYDVRSTGVEQDDWVMVKDAPMTTNRLERMRIDTLQSTGIGMMSLSMELDMLNYRLAEASRRVNASVGKTTPSPLVCSDEERSTHQMNHFVQCLMSSVPPLDAPILTAEWDEDEAALLAEVQGERHSAFQDILSFFEIDPSRRSVNGAVLPPLDGPPESTEHAIALGHVAHLCSVVANVYAIELPHPILATSDRSRIAERTGLAMQQFIPLFQCKGFDRQHLRKAVDFLRNDICCLIAATKGEQPAVNLSLAEGLRRLSA